MLLTGIVVSLAVEFDAVSELVVVVSVVSVVVVSVYSILRTKGTLLS